MKDFSRFNRYWGDWQGKLSAPVQRNSAKIRFPSHLIEKKIEDEQWKLYPPHPICIFNAPQKASSTKRGLSHRQAIFIDGSFTLKRTPTGPYLINGASSISLFSTKPLDCGGLEMEELEAVHFDMEPTSSPRAYHPTFHAQRDISNTLSDETIRESVLQFDRGYENQDIRIKRFDVRGAQHLRLPTPQMDLFAVLTMVVADFFCNGGDKDAKVLTQFKAVLSHLTNSNNLAREGIDAHALSARSDGAHTCPAHWYPEYS